MRASTSELHYQAHGLPGSVILLPARRVHLQSVMQSLLRIFLGWLFLTTAASAMQAVESPKAQPGTASSVSSAQATSPDHAAVRRGRNRAPFRRRLKQTRRLRPPVLKRTPAVPRSPQSNPAQHPARLTQSSLSRHPLRLTGKCRHRCLLNRRSKQGPRHRSLSSRRRDCPRPRIVTLSSPGSSPPPRSLR